MQFRRQPDPLKRNSKKNFEFPAIPGLRTKAPEEGRLRVRNRPAGTRKCDPKAQRSPLPEAACFFLHAWLRTTHS